jgi:hypothetical protein
LQFKVTGWQLSNNFNKGICMKPKNGYGSITVKAQGKVSNEEDGRRNRLRVIGVRLAAIFLVIVFLASECAAILPVG